MADLGTRTINWDAIFGNIFVSEEIQRVQITSRVSANLIQGVSSTAQQQESGSRCLNNSTFVWRKGRYTPNPTRRQKSCIKSSVKEKKKQKQKTKTKPGPSLVISDTNSKSLQGFLTHLLTATWTRNSTQHSQPVKTKETSI